MSRYSRREFLIIGSGAVGAVALAACGATASRPTTDRTSTSASYFSRPDLKPPLISVDRSKAMPGPGLLFVTPGEPVVVDDAGEPVWIHQLNIPTNATNLKVQHYRGEPVLTWWQGDIVNGVGANGEYVVLDSSYRKIMTVKAHDGISADLHEFLIADDVAYFTAYRPITTDLRPVGGARRGAALDATIQGVDLTTGSLVFDWHSADHVDLTESHLILSAKAPYDPVHINSIGFTADKKLLVSARNTWTIYKIDPASGEILWRFGGKRNDFELRPGVHFAWQHDARQHADGVVSLFDDESAPKEAAQSRGLFVRLDESAMTAELVRAFEHPRMPLLSGSQGSVQVLENGNVLVGWGEEPYFTEYRSDGEVVLDAKFEQRQSYRALRFGWTGTPVEKPAVAAEHLNGRTRVYASWNGSTETASWQVLGGKTPNSLRPMATRARTGFETEIELTASPPYLAARALDRRGGVLSTSPVITA